MKSPVFDGLLTLTKPNGDPIGLLVEGDEVSLRGAFVDPGDEEVSLIVDWGDDGAMDTIVLPSGGGPFTANHRFVDNASQISIRLLDDDLGDDERAITVNVSNVAPQATILGPATGVEGNSINLLASATDAGSADELNYDWVVSIGGSEIATGSDQAFSFTPPDDGTYDVTLSVRDDDGAVTAVTSTLSIANATPRIPAASLRFLDTTGTTVSSIAEGSELRLEGQIVDSGLQDDHEVVIDWGDLTPPLLLTVPAGQSNFFATYTYQDDDPTGTASDRYDISIDVRDFDGGSSSTPAAIEVTNVMPALRVVDNGSDASTVRLIVNITDPGVNDTFEYVWSVDAALLPAGTPIDEPSIEFPRPTGGGGNVSVTVTDDDGGERTATAIFVAGNDQPNEIVIATDPATGEVSVSLADVGGPSQSQTFPQADSVIVTAGGGNDVIDVDPLFMGSVAIAAGEGDDTVQSGGGNDVIVGGPGNDVIDAGEGDNQIDISDGNDTVTAGGGNDVYVISGFSDKTLTDTGGVDTLDFSGVPNPGVDAIDGITLDLSQSDGTPQTVRTGGSVSLSGQFENVSGTNFKDQLKGNEADNLLFGGGGEDTLDAGSGNDSISGGDGNDLIFSGASGNDLVFGGADGDDTIDGGADDDSIVGGEGNDLIFGGSGHDSIISGTGDESIDGGDGNDLIFGGAGGTDTVNGGSGDDSIQGGSGNDLIFGGADNDTIISGSGDESIDGGDGNDVIFGGFDDGTDTIDGGAGDDSINGSDGNDLIFGGQGHDTIHSGLGDESIDGGSGNDLIFGGADNRDTIDGGSGDDSIVGGGGNDLIFGGADNDTITSGSGDESISGGSGNDLIFGGIGDGNDTIDGGLGDDSIRGGEGNDLIFGGTGNDTISSGTGDESIDGGDGNDLIFGGSSGSDTVLGGNGEDSIVGGGGNDLIFGGADNDTITSGTGNESIDGGSGNDLIFGGSSLDQDTINAGSGDDSIVGGEGNDLIFGGLGNDTIRSGGGDESILGGDGNDLVFGGFGEGTDTIDGGAGDDSIYGGDGNDLIFGGSGADTVISGSGDESIAGGEGNDLIFGGSSIDRDTIDGGAGDDSIVGGNGNDLIFGGAGADTILAGDGIESIEGGDGNDLIFGGAASGDTLDGGGGDDSIFGGDGNDVIFGGIGNDSISSGRGDESIDGGSGNDLIFGGLGDGQDSIDGGSGDDSIIGGDGNDLIFGGPGADTIEAGPGDESILGGDGNDLIFGSNGGFDSIEGGSGDDSLVGGEGNDLIFGGMGNDTIMASGGDDSLEGGEGNDLIFAVAEISSTLSDNELVVDQSVVPLSGFERARLQSGVSGSTLDASAASLAVQFVGSDSSDFFVGGSGRNTYWFGDGDDTVAGGTGTNEFRFASGDQGTKTLSGNGIENAVDFRAFDQAISIDLEDTAPQQVNSELMGLEQPLTLVLSGNFQTAFGTDFPDQIFGNSLDNKLYGLGGIDLIEGREGDDLIQAGITRRVFLDFVSATEDGEYAYSTVERAAIESRIKQDFTAFDVEISQTRPDQGEYVTILFNAAVFLPGSTNVLGGISNRIGWRELAIDDVVQVDVNGFFGDRANQLPPTSENLIALSSTIAAHELAHTYGIRHQDAFGPPGSGVYAGLDNAGRYRPVYTGPAAASETRFHLIASPAAVGTTLVDALGNPFFGEREALKLAFSETGRVIREQSDRTPGGFLVEGRSTPESVQSLGALPYLTVPNTVIQGAAAGRELSAAAINVIGQIQLDGETSENDFYSFEASAGDVVTIEIYSQALRHRIGNPIDSVLRVYDEDGVLVAYYGSEISAFNDDQFEPTDSTLLDLVLDQTGTYYVEVDTFSVNTLERTVYLPNFDADAFCTSNPDSIVCTDRDTGSYELFIYRFDNDLAPEAVADVLNGGSGADLFIGNSGREEYLGFSTIDGDTKIDSSGGGFVSPLPPSLVPLDAISGTEGMLVEVQASLEPGQEPVFWSIEQAGAATFPEGASIDSATGLIQLLPLDSGEFEIRVRATSPAGLSATTILQLNIDNVRPQIADILIDDTLAEQKTFSLRLDFTDAGKSDTHEVIVDWGDGQSESLEVTQGNGDGFAVGDHTYDEDGDYLIGVTVRDDDGLETTQTLMLSTVPPPGARLVDRTLQITGTPDDDQVFMLKLFGVIKVYGSFLPGNGWMTFRASDVDDLDIRTYDGNDYVQVSLLVGAPATIDLGSGDDTVLGGSGDDLIRGGPGNDELVGRLGDDTIYGGSGDDLLWGLFGDDVLMGDDGDDDLYGDFGDDILLGGNGADFLDGGLGSDVLIGGAGSDRMKGDGGSDLLIGGYTAFDSDLAALTDIRQEWTSDRSYNRRVNNLRDGSGTSNRVNGSTFLVAGITVFDDGESDRVRGGSGRDWFFALLDDGEDTILNQRLNETIEEVFPDQG